MKVFLITLVALVAFAGVVHAQRRGTPSPPAAGAGKGNADRVVDARWEAQEGGVDREAFDEQRRLYDAERKALRDALKAEIEALGQGAKRAEVNAVVAKFREKNALLIDAQRSVAEALKEAAKEVQSGDRANVPDAVKEMRALLEKSRAAKKASHNAFRKAIENAETPEKRREAFDEHLAEQRDHHKQVRDDLKKLREELRNRHIDDARRPEE